MADAQVPLEVELQQLGLCCFLFRLLWLGRWLPWVCIAPLIVHLLPLAVHLQAWR